jgi:exonuclease SbcD
LRVVPELPAVLMGHFTVDTSRSGSERQVMVGREVFVQISEIADPLWDYVALGHIHRHQNLNPTDDPPVVYAGSLERVDFGEEKQPKGFCWVEVLRGATTWRYIEVPARPFITIRVDVRQETRPLRAIERAIADQDLSGAVTRLVVEMTPEQEPRLRDADLSPLLSDAFFAQINRDVERTTRIRLAGMEPDAMTPLHLLERYLQSKGKTDAEITPYLAEAQAVFAEDGVRFEDAEA